MAEKPVYTASKETLRRIAAELAGVQFTEEELEQLAPQVASLLADLSTLEELDLSRVEPALLFICSEETSHDR
jgi:Asp-tRNA(Asn)/Glu-tRNA(Gln) amidotransferase C subunit